MRTLQFEFRKVQYTYLGSEVGGWSYIFMLGLHSSPRMVYFETFIAIACTAVHAALCGLLRWRLAEITHNSNGCPGCLSVSFHNGFQSEVAKQAIDATLSEINIPLATRTRKQSWSRSQWITFSACVDNKIQFRMRVNQAGLDFKRSTEIYKWIPDCSTLSKPVQHQFICSLPSQREHNCPDKVSVMSDSKGHHKHLL